jgi:hypothetical protein
MGFRNGQSFQEDRDFKFDARLRYVENLINAWIIFLQAEAHRKTGQQSPPEREEYNKSLYELYYLLQIHDDKLETPDLKDINEEYIKKLLNHEQIKQLTENKLKKKTIEEEIDEDFS